MKKRKEKRKQLLSGLTAAVLTLLLLPCLAAPASAATSWMQSSIDKLVGWGVMRGDDAGNMNGDSSVTRAEFVSMINRAFGYDDPGTMPFTDVLSNDWFSDDIATAYNMGYFTGTTSSLATPDNTLTREQAVTILGRNLMLQPTDGEVTEFTDGRSISDWSRGYVRTAKADGIVSGYPDGSFGPQTNITRGEAAELIVKAVGTLINTAGSTSLGDVYGNVTISASGTTLRNTTIAGNLYITAGLDTGDVTLENVNVLGQIIVCGSGASNKGDNSVILRNVTSSGMTLDSLAGQYVSVEADGDTVIDNVSVMTSAYLEDRTGAKDGFLHITFDAEDGSDMTVAGNVKEVINKTSGSTLQVASGVAKSVTVDESAIGSTVVVAKDGVISDLNLDVTTAVSGGGDIDNLDVSAAGCTCTILPDTITIRPGLTSVIAGQTMDSVAAEESSSSPRILAGYPSTATIASTSLIGIFSTNKSGTLYWGVSAEASGALTEEQLIGTETAPALVKGGKLTIAASNTENKVAITGLVQDTTYYLSAVLVDSRGQTSPVKKTTFTTTDDTVPAFCSGYPYMSKISNTSAQTAVMATKNCKLYYAVLLSGSSALTSNDFLSDTIEGSYGFSSMELSKNTSAVFTVNTKDLSELVSYDIYYWLVDNDNGKSSEVKKLTFTTVDKTPPVFNTTPTVNSVKTTSIGLTFNLNEAGTVYWVAVKSGTTYPVPLAGQASDAVTLDSDTAKLEVSSGMNGIKSGNVAATAAKDGTITVSGLETQTAYDIYYVAKDKSGNYSAAVGYVTANTEDNIPPTVTQEFTRYNGTTSTKPLANTDIRIVFSEGVQEADSESNLSLMALYTAVTAAKTAEEKTAAQEALTEALRDTILLYTVNANGTSTQVAERTGNETTQTAWVLDYRYATVSLEDGKTVVTFPTTSDSSTSALNLNSGSSYFFQIQNICDTSISKNRMGTTTLTTFTTVFAQVDLATTSISTFTCNGDSVDADMMFQMVPASTGKVEDAICWDMLLWSDTTVNYELYRKVVAKDGTTVESAWTLLGTGHLTNTDGTSANVGLSLTRDFLTTDNKPVFEQLNKLEEGATYTYAIRFTSIEGDSERNNWSDRVNFGVTIAAGNSTVLSNLSVSVTTDDWTEAQTDGATSIGLPASFSMKKQFTDQNAPSFSNNTPQFAASDTSVNMTLLLNRSGTIYYVVAKQGLISTVDGNGTIYPGTDAINAGIPTSGSGSVSPPTLSLPTYLNIVSPKYSNTLIKTGHITGDTGTVSLKISDLEPATDYYVYFVLKGTGQVFSNVLCYQFTTTEIERPVLTLDLQNPSVNITSSDSADINYALLVDGSCPSAFYQPFNKYADTSSMPANSGYADDSFTVLDAMIEGYTVDDKLQGSVFDAFARQTAKDSFATLIRNQKADSGGTVALVGSTTVAANGTATVDCKNVMSGSTWYCFLAVGRQTNGTGDAFRAIRPVLQKDTTPPMVVSCATTVTDTKLPTTLSAAKNYPYTGYMTLTFDEQLYYVSRNSSTLTQTIKPIEAEPIGSLTNGYVSLDSVLSLNDTAVSYVPKLGACNEIRFQFKNMYYNEAITISASVCDASGNVHTVPLTLTLNVSSADAEGNYTPYFTITSSWDSTG